jgi:hypothetical protein
MVVPTLALQRDPFEIHFFSLMHPPWSLSLSERAMPRPPPHQKPIAMKMNSSI